jgi:hypothetical protein
VSAANRHLVSDDAIDQFAARLDRQWTVLIICALPIRMRGEKCGNVGRMAPFYLTR